MCHISKSNTLRKLFHQFYQKASIHVILQMNWDVGAIIHYALTIGDRRVQGVMNYSPYISLIHRLLMHSTHLAG